MLADATLEVKIDAMFTSRVCIDEQQVVKPTMLLTTLHLSFMHVLPVTHRRGLGKKMKIRASIGDYGITEKQHER